MEDKANSYSINRNSNEKNGASSSSIHNYCLGVSDLTQTDRSGYNDLPFLQLPDHYTHDSWTRNTLFAIDNNEW